MKDRDPKYPGRIQLVPVDAANGIYDVVRADAPTEQGTPLNRATLLSAQACKDVLADPSAATPSDMFLAIKKAAQVGTVIQSVRTDLGDAWALCNGDAVDPKTYPTLYEKLTPITLLNARYKTIDSGYDYISNVCYANGYYVYLKGVYKEGLYVMVSTDGLNYEKGITIDMGDYGEWPTNLIYYNGRFIAPYKYRTSPYYEKAYSFDDPLSGSATFQDISNDKYSYSTYGAFLLDNYAMVLGGDIYYTSDGTSWLSANVGLGSEWNGHEKDKILKGKGYYVIGDFYAYGSSSRVDVWVSNQLLNGYTNKTIVSGTGATLAGTFFDGERFVLVAKSGTWFYATNPTGTWSEKTEPASDWVIYENGYYYTSKGYKKNWDDAWTPYDNATLTPSRFMGVVNNIAQGGSPKESSNSDYVLLKLARLGKELPLLASDATGSQPTYHYIKVKEE